MNKMSAQYRDNLNKPKSLYSNATTRQNCVSCPSSCSCNLGGRSTMDQLMFRAWSKGPDGDPSVFHHSSNACPTCGRVRGEGYDQGAVPGQGPDSCTSSAECTSQEFCYNGMCFAKDPCTPGYMSCPQGYNCVNFNPKVANSGNCAPAPNEGYAGSGGGSCSNDLCPAQQFCYYEMCFPKAPCSPGSCPQGYNCVNFNPKVANSGNCAPTPNPSCTSSADCPPQESCFNGICITGGNPFV